MSLSILLPVKGFEAAKTRLSSVLSAVERIRLARAMFLDTLNAIKAVSVDTKLVIVTGNDEVNEFAADAGAEVVEDPEKGLNPALEAGRDFIFSKEASALLVLPSDIPALTPEDVNQLQKKAQQSGSAVIVPDRHEKGTNALLLHRDMELPFCFGLNSFDAHLRQATVKNIPIEVEHCPGIAEDCDLPEDLERLSGLGVGKHTKALLQEFSMPDHFELRHAP